VKRDQKQEPLGWAGKGVCTPEKKFGRMERWKSRGGKKEENRGEAESSQGAGYRKCRTGYVSRGWVATEEGERWGGRWSG